ncbi:ketopantoate reductase family protein [Paenibacillus puldeungensis]|uniref:Ketopantoate reductase family protein n=1 Tax=Paenibacillus puldeungensis TaxID=696536 RepID=A0ABW3S605_9BACL
MKALVYGAGVLGSYLAHVLVRASHDVTLLARGKRYDELVQHGLVIRHAAQMKTTKDHVNLIQSLQPEDIYDIIFVVIQYTQLEGVLPILAANQSKLIVLVGNNMAPRATKAAICGSNSDKIVLFAFQFTGGRRENGKIISIHARAKMALGTLNGEDFAPQRNLLQEAFTSAKYALNFRCDMEAYLLAHVAFVMPIAYACYATNGNLKKEDKALIQQIMSATAEGYEVLKANGIRVPHRR